MPIGAVDQSYIRGQIHTVKPYFNVWQPSVVASARINQSSFGYPLGQLTVDNTSNWSAIDVGMRYRVLDTDNSTLVSTGIVRKSPTSTVLFIDGKSIGDAGQATQIAGGFADNQYVYIYNDYPLWTLLSRIVDRVFFKKFDVAYTDEGSNPAPVVNLGGWKQAFIDPVTSVGTVALSASGSFAWGSKSISTYAWDIPAGLTVTIGTVSSRDLTVTGPVGFYIVRCTVTDNGGASFTGVRPLWINDRTTGANGTFSSRFAFEIGSDRQDVSGRDWEITLHASNDLTESVLLDGVGFHFFEESTFGNGSQVLSSGVSIDEGVGLVSTETRTGAFRKNRLTLTVSSPHATLNEIPMVSQAIIETASPSNWTEVSAGLATPNFVIWYVLQHHAPNVLKLFDFNIFPESPPRKRRYALNGSTVQQQTDEGVKLIGGNYGSASSGAFFALRNPMIEDQGFRNAMDERIEITERDIVGEVAYPQKYRTNIGQLYLYGFALINETPVPLASVAPGRAQGQASGRSQQDTLLVNSQVELNQKAGHLFALENRPTPEIRLTLNRNFDIFDPARHYNTWWRVNIDGAYNPRGGDLNFRALCTGVDRQWEQTPNGAWVKRVNVTLQPESFGQAGETMPVNTGGAESYLWEPEYLEAESYATTQRSFAFAWDDQGSIGRTFNFNALSPNWESIKGDIEGIVCDMVVDPNGELVQSGYTEGALPAFACVHFGNTASVWYTPDLLSGVVSWSKLNEQTMQGVTSTTSGRIAASKTVAGLFAYAYRDPDGTYVVWTEDYGATWSLKAKADDTVQDDNQNNNAPFGFFIDGQATVTTARIDANNYRVRWSASPGSAFATVSSCPTSQSPFIPIVVDSDGLLYTARDAYTVTGANNYGITVDAPPTGGWTYNHIGTPNKGIATMVYSDGTTGDLSLTAFVSKANGDADDSYTLTLQADITLPRDYNEVSALNWEVGYNYIASGINYRTVTNKVTFYDGLNNEIATYSASFVAGPGASPVYPVIATNPTAVKRIVVEMTMPYTLSASLNAARIYMDNISMSTVDERNFERRLLVVDDYQGSAVWTDISPVKDGVKLIPKTPYSLNIDPVYPGGFSLLAENLSALGRYQYDSTDYGLSWTEVGANIYPFRGIKRVDDVIIRWGNERIFVQTGGLASSSEDRTGNWSINVGGLGNFLGVIALL